MTIQISEIFLSLQGEGKYIGLPHVFVRLAGCHTQCRWCDTDYSCKEVLSTEEIAARIEELYHQGCWVSLTGGEPLLQAEALVPLLQDLKGRGRPVYLETSGVLVEPLRRVISWVDVVAMDIKLPSSTGQQAFWNEHQEFLHAAVQKDVFVKIVVTPDTAEDELKRSAEIIAGESCDITLCLQPEHADLTQGSLQRCMEFQRLASLSLNDVRVIPQMHKLVSIA